MTTIDKLGVSGIRSFEPRREVTIRFLKPLTIILGHNGAGKTTIIECMKMACTGDLPPFTDKGGAFVHDPKISSSPDTKAKIRLQFRDISGRKIVVNRQFQVTNKANKKQEFKTVEQSLQYTNEGGEKQTFSHRCNDVNKAVPELMGVSKAILENVIFVHQEESLWPLGDGKKLKEKFDDIFASTRYTKALEAIRKQRKEHSTVIRLKKSELALWQDRMERAERIQKDCNSVEQEHNELQERVEDLKRQMLKVQAELQELGKTLVALDKLRQDLRQAEAQRAAKVETKDSLYDALEEELEDSDEDLHKWMEQASAKLKGYKASRQQRQDQTEVLQLQVNGLIEEQKTASADKGRIEAEAKMHAQDRATVEALKADLLRDDRLGLREGRDQLRVEDSNEKWAHVLAKNFQALEAKVTETVDGNRRRENAAFERLNKVLLEVEQLEHTVQTSRNAAVEGRKRAHEKRSTELDAGEEDLEATLEVERDREKRASEEVQKLQSQSHGSEVQQRHDEVQKELQKLRRRIASLHDERKAHAHEEDARARVQLLREQLREKERALKSKESQLEASAQGILGSSVKLSSGDLQESISGSIVELETSLETAESSLVTERNLCQGKEVELKLLEERVTSLQGSLADAGSRLLEASEGRWDASDRGAFDHEIKQRHESSKRASEAAGSLRFGAEFLGAMLERTKQSHCCPTCERDLRSEDEYDRLLVKLKERRDERTGPSFQEVESRANEEAAKLAEMQSLIPLWNERQKVERERHDLNESRDKLREALLASSNRVRIQENELALAQSRKNEVEELKRLSQDLSTIKREHERLGRDVDMETRKLRQTEDGRNIVKIDEELAECHEESDRIGLVAERLQKQRDAGIRQRSSVESSYREQRERVLELERKVEERKRIRAEVAEMLSAASRLEAESKSASMQLPDLLAKKQTLEDEKERTAEECRKEEAAGRKELNSYQESVSEFTTLQKKIAAFVSGGKTEKLEQLDARLADNDDRLKQIREEISNLDSADAKDADAANAFEVMVRNMNENLRYRKAAAEVTTVEKEISARKNEMLELTGGRDIDEEHGKHETEWNILNAKRHSTEGKAEGVRHRYEALAAELEQANATGSAKEYRRLLTELKTLELANSDLEKYHRALDQALMTYHTLKMSEINKTIKELWETTYQGTDIDYIEIVSDVDSGADTAKTQIAKRNYNYRVAMRRGDALLDMRGRCSAGQKVLACLVIRLALAESFALDCGILALDEPTTNLDRRNMEKLAASLADIINHRRRQANFQLILITHDEEFIELLGSRDICDSYYLVYKDEEGFSRVKQQELANFG